MCRNTGSRKRKAAMRNVAALRKGKNADASRLLSNAGISPPEHSPAASADYQRGVTPFLPVNVVRKCRKYGKSASHGEGKVKWQQQRVLNA